MKEVYDHRFMNIEEKKQLKKEEEMKKEVEKEELEKKQRLWEDEETELFFKELGKIKQFRDMISEQIAEKIILKKREIDREIEEDR